MGMLIGLFLKWGVPARFARYAAFAAIAVAILLALGAVKCAYDRNLIRTHDAERNAEIAKADREADAKAAVERRADDARSASESQEIKEAINEARSEGRDPRVAYYLCVQLQQAARADRKPPPAC